MTSLLIRSILSVGAILVVAACEIEPEPPSSGAITVGTSAPEDRGPDRPPELDPPEQQEVPLGCGCLPVYDPWQVDFGTLPPSAYKEATLAVVNEGTAPCEVAEIELKECHLNLTHYVCKAEWLASFEIGDAPVPGNVLMPGESFAIEVEFRSPSVKELEDLQVRRHFGRVSAWFEAGCRHGWIAPKWEHSDGINLRARTELTQR